MKLGSGVKLLTPPERIIKPRKLTDIRMPIIVVDENMNCYYEKDDRMVAWDLIELVRYLEHNWPVGPSERKRTLPIMLTCHNPHRAFIRVHEQFKGHPEWQVRLNSTESTLNGKVNALSNLHVRLFGFRDPNRQTRYFHPITPLDFMRTFDYGDPKLPEYIRLYEWAGRVRSWIKKHKLRFSPTKGGLAAQLLRDPKFYPEMRRKVPKLTNEKARVAMPGNFYAATVSKRLYGTVYLIDQENAHHYAARTVELPSSDRLEAKGHYRSMEDKPYASPGSVTYEMLMAQHGLLKLRVFVPKHLKGVLPPWAHDGGLRSIFVYTNEISLLESLGVEIRHVSYGWLSNVRDTGLAQYARWAEAEVRKYPREKDWLKSTLLSAYGILGAKPRRLESAYWRSDKGKVTPYIFGSYADSFKQIVTEQEIQSPVANTIQRGMIEAETRRLSIEMARQLEAEGQEVIAVHADGIIINDEGQQLPLLPPPWRIKHHLSKFKMLDTVSFESQALTILPGRKRGTQ